jgi:Zn-dependent protease
MWSWNIGRIFGIDTRVHASFLLLLLWAAWSSYAGVGTVTAAVVGVAFMVAVFASVIAHELGHALTARSFGIGTREILLLPIGGVAQIEQARMSPRVELLVALAGPVVSFLLAGVLFTFGAVLGDVTTNSFIGALAWANLGLAVFNMLPAFPMDGGRVLRAALARRMGHDRATSIAATIGKWAAVGLGVLALFAGKLMLGLVAMFLWFSATSESRHLPPWRPFSRDVGPTRRPVTVLHDPTIPAEVEGTIVRDRFGRTWLIRGGNHWN